MLLSTLVVAPYIIKKNPYRNFVFYKKIIINAPSIIKNYIVGNTTYVDKINLNISDLE